MIASLPANWELVILVDSGYGYDKVGGRTLSYVSARFNRVVRCLAMLACLDDSSSAFLSFGRRIILIRYGSACTTIMTYLR